jgi:hypothetical protein
MSGIICVFLIRSETIRERTLCGEGITHITAWDADRVDRNEYQKIPSIYCEA